MSRTYRIADLVLRIEEKHLFFNGLKPFQVTDGDSLTAHCTVQYDPDAGEPVEGLRLLDTFDFPDAEAVCRLFRVEGEYRFSMTTARGLEVRFLIPDEGNVQTNFEPGDDPSLFRFGLWMAFNLCAIRHGVAAIHSSVLVYEQGAVLCLGESGTGKSTHTRLWREHIEGAELLNDDSPFIGIREGVATVYGSPWSGKTPCYRNLRYPIRGFMRLSQASYNEIRKLSTLSAYGALQPSMPPSFAHDEKLFDGVNNLLSELLRLVKVYHLACLPNVEAALLARDTIFKTNN